MNKIVKIFLTVFFIFVAILATGYIYYNSQLAPVSQSDDEMSQFFEVERGQTPAVIATSLKEQNLIKDERSFLAYIRLNNLAPSLKAGNYLLSDHMSVQEITEVLVSGVSVQKRFTVPEGFAIWEIAELFEKANIMSQEEFWELAIDEEFPEYEFLQGIKNDRHRMEGYLFPETYYISGQESPRKIFTIMLDQFEKVLSRMPENKSGLTSREVLILASVVEKEAVSDKERPVIASVFLNRIDINMRLQSCATIQYALEERKEVLYFSDLEIESPYNTYKYAGLMPTPISNVGERSLRAVYEPADTDYLFFFAKNDGTGEHIFTRSNEEHEREMRNWGYRQ